MTEFNMPGAGASFEARGGWLVQALATQFGLTLAQAAGIVGNLGFESGGFKELQEIAPLAGGAGGYGWAQWTGPRRVAYMSWCSTRGLAPSSDEANYGYLVAELSVAYHNTINAVKRAATIDAAVFSVGQTYERPYGTTATHLPGYAERLAWAKRALAGAQGALPGVTSNAPVSSPIPSIPAAIPPNSKSPAVAPPAPSPVSGGGSSPDDTEELTELTREANPGVSIP